MVVASALFMLAFALVEVPRESLASATGQPTVSINDVIASEGNSGTTAFVFTLTLSSPTSQQVTVDFATSDGTAMLANSDYQAASGTLTIPPQATGGTITVLVNGDTTQEAAETFVITLSNPVNSSLGSQSAGTGAILNDDPPPEITIDDMTISEGDSGKTLATLTLQLSQPTAAPVTATLQYSTADGTATVADNDYQPTSGTLTFPDKATSATLTIPVNGDITNEPDESLFVNLTSPQHGVIRDNQAIVTVKNDDDTTPPVVEVIIPGFAPTENYIVGTPVKVLWVTTDTNPCTADVYLSLDYGATYDTIATRTPDDGSLFWTPGVATNQGCRPIFSALLKVVVHDCAGNVGQDISDNLFSIYDDCGASLLSLFSANPVEPGIEVRWQFTDPASFGGVALERSDAPNGPWDALAIDRHDESGMVVAMDRTVIAGVTYFYRLMAHTKNGELVIFGPISATAGTPITEFALNSIAPNPSPGRTRIEYSVAHASPVRLSIIDVTGREVAVLTEGMSRPGRYQAIWSGETSSGRRVPAGTYFVHYRSPERESVRPLALVP